MPAGGSAPISATTAGTSATRPSWARAIATVAGMRIRWPGSAAAVAARWPVAVVVAAGSLPQGAEQAVGLELAAGVPEALEAGQRGLGGGQFGDAFAVFLGELGDTEGGEVADLGSTVSVRGSASSCCSQA